MLHAVFLLVAAREFVLLDDAREIVVHPCAHHEPVLRLALHGLGIDVILLLVVLHKPSTLLKLPEVVGRTLIDARIIIRRALREIDFGLDDVVETLFVVAGFEASLSRVEHIVGAALHRLHEMLGGTNPPEWFDGSHSLRL